jgi:hypothetical protein
VGTMANHGQPILRWFFALAALEAGAALFALIDIPTGTQGLSLGRLALLAALGVPLFGAAFLAARPPKALDGLVRVHVVAGLYLFFVLAAVALFLLRYLNPETLLPYYERLAPLLWYLCILALQTALFLTYLKFGFHLDALSPSWASFRPFAIALGTLLLMFLFVALTRIGLAPDSAYWGEPGVPVLGWQFALCALACVLVSLGSLIGRMPSRLDIWLIALVWTIAVVVWLSVPSSITRNSFYGPMTPPANVPYPNSDAGYYDSMAESLLIGHPYQAQIPTRPLYILLLTALHLAVGEDYWLIIGGQTLVLALIPVLLYLLGKALHSRAAGFTVALFAIFREWTTLMVSSQTRVSDSRTLLVDMPTLLLLCVCCLFAVRWLSRRDGLAALLCGGSFGLLLLLRTQSLLLVPFVVLLALLAYGRRNRRLIPAVGLFGGALVLTLLPWLVHNFLASGRLTLDAPFQFQIIASQYQYTGNLDINNVDLQGKSLLGLLLTFLLRDPRFVVGFVSTHFFATLINSVLVLPLLEPYNGLRAAVNLYWLQWAGNLDAPNTFLVGAYLSIIALGLSVAWRRLKWAGLVPLTFAVAYALANGFGRFSGWRYDLPADWIAYFYLGLGLAAIVAGLARLFAGKDTVAGTNVDDSAAPRLGLRAGALTMAAFVLVGSLPWAAQALSAPRYPEQDPRRLAEELAGSRSVHALGVDGQEIQAFAVAPGAYLEIGRLLYPRFFTRDTGLASAHPWPAYAPRDFPRLGFMLLNEGRQDIVFPARQINGEVPNAADVIVLGCDRGDYMEARLLLFPGDDLGYLSAPLGKPCQ